MRLYTSNLSSPGRIIIVTLTAAAPSSDVAVNIGVNAAEISHIDPGDSHVEMSCLETNGVVLGQDSNIPEMLAYVSEWWL
ncbi:hypothetical protein E4U17_007166 [Claviceps sp. LM77 group G4]|nr:hypothetical protein E4U17_007166 [Claviceps sp. LM77 group G4]KAG6064649.1 hypothetical protein E4U33_006061 [Claviceps sp. LM78 group G4]KAG6071227.1 hypothetical protein E4U16_006289 [Claviceps sp. LM84 group G4]